MDQIAVNSISTDSFKLSKFSLLDYASSASEDILQVIEEEKRDLDENAALT